MLFIQAAQLRREEKIRAEKEKIMNEDDSEKQRRLEVCINMCFVVNCTSVTRGSSQ